MKLMGKAVKLIDNQWIVNLRGSQITYDDKPFNKKVHVAMEARVLNEQFRVNTPFRFKKKRGQKDFIKMLEEFAGIIFENRKK